MKNISMRTRGFDILFTTIILMVILGLSSCPPPFTEDMYAFVKDTAGFTATPGNHKATLDWVVDPFAESYSIYYTTNGMQPSENYGYKIRNVEPPYVLTGLENGCMHVFQSRAHYSNAEDSVSDYVKAISLSDTMLTPKATSGYEQIKVEWDSIPGITAYEVYRSLNEKGNYTNITGWLYSSSFIDTQVINGQKYFYKVKPGMEDGILSSASSGETYKFPERDQRKWEIGSCYVPVAAREVYIKGSYAYVAAASSGLRIIDIDISNPSSPFEIGYYDTPGSASGVVISGSYAYVADGSVGGLCIIDLWPFD
ncbi:MAG TPA: hypothetical protein ENI06_04980 [Spirochaetales bacterium]|nr:hypothetical protein [Spirochaetales bacterium]